jgi:hypothetical protein
VKVGIRAGEPVTDDNDDLFGAAVQLAARLCESVSAGEIAASIAVRELCAGKRFRFEQWGPVQLKGFPRGHHCVSRVVAPRRLISCAAGFPLVALRTDCPFRSLPRIRKCRYGALGGAHRRSSDDVLCARSVRRGLEQIGSYGR